MKRMQRFFLTTTLAVILSAMASTAHAQRRPSFADKPLDTSKRLYVRPSGTRVYSDPAPPKRRVWRYKGKNGRVVTKTTGKTLSRTKAKPRAKRTQRKSRRTAR